MKINVNLQTLPIDNVRPNPWNPNVQSDFIFQKELESIKEHGFIDPILVREKDDYYEIIDGEHRWRAAQKVGLLEISANNLGVISDESSKRLTIIMNETRGKADKTELSKLLSELEAEIGIEELVRSLPYTEDELNHMIAENKIDWDNVSAEMPTEEKDTKEPQKEPGFTIFQVKLTDDVHNQLMHQLNRIKLQLAPGQDPSEISTADAMDYMIRHIVKIQDDKLLIQ